MSTPKSVFDGMEAAPPDAIFNVLARYKEDNFPKKVNLSVGGEPRIRVLPFLV